MSDSRAWTMPLVAPDAYMAYAKGLSDGRRAERAAIVAWLRKRNPSGVSNMYRYAEELDACIQDGDHLRGDG